MKFSYAHHMPYTDIKEVGQDWPVPNKQFDPELGAEMFDTYLEDKIYAEQAGFDAIGNNEHHMSPYGMMPNPNLVAAVIANRTKHALIQQTGVIVPLANPIRLAEEYAMIDVMSKGRLVAGFRQARRHRDQMGQRAGLACQTHDGRSARHSLPGGQAPGRRRLGRRQRCRVIQTARLEGPYGQTASRILQGRYGRRRVGNTGWISAGYRAEGSDQ